MKFTYFFFILFFFETTKAGTVDTVNIYSNGMHKFIKCVVIHPDSYKKNKHSYPVVYLLHGYGGWYSNMIIRMPHHQDKQE